MCDTLNRRVVVFDMDGSFVQQGTEDIGEGQFFQPRGVVVNGNEVIVNDFVIVRVQVFGLDGSFVRQLGGKGGGAGQFQLVSSTFWHCSERGRGVGVQLSHSSLPVMGTAALQLKRPPRCNGQQTWRRICHNDTHAIVQSIVADGSIDDGVAS